MDLFKVAFCSLLLILFSVPGFFLLRVQSRLNNAFNIRFGLLTSFISSLITSLLISFLLFALNDISNILFYSKSGFNQLYYIFDFQWFDHFLDMLSSPEKVSKFELKDTIFCIFSKLLPATIIITFICSLIVSFLKLLTPIKAFNLLYRTAYQLAGIYFYVEKFYYYVKRNNLKTLGFIKNKKFITIPFKVLLQVFYAVLLVAFLIVFAVVFITVIISLIFISVTRVDYLLKIIPVTIFHVVSALRSPIDKMFYKNYSSLFGINIVEILVSEKNLVKGVLESIEISKDGRLEFITISNVIMYSLDSNGTFFDRSSRKVHRFPRNESLFTIESSKISNINSWTFHPLKTEFADKIESKHQLDNYFWYLDIVILCCPWTLTFKNLQPSNLAHQFSYDFFVNLVNRIENYKFLAVAFRRRMIKNIFFYLRKHLKENKNYYANNMPHRKQLLEVLSKAKEKHAK